MLNYIKAEIIKSKRTFSKKAIIIIPLITYILSLILMGGQGGKEQIMFFFNIWYNRTLAIIPYVKEKCKSFFKKLKNIF